LRSSEKYINSGLQGYLTSNMKPICVTLKTIKDRSQELKKCVQICNIRYFCVSARW